MSAYVVGISPGLLTQHRVSPMTAYTMGVPDAVLSMIVTSCTECGQAALCHVLNMDY